MSNLKIKKFKYFGQCQMSMCHGHMAMTMSFVNVLETAEVEFELRWSASGTIF